MNSWRTHGVRTKSQSNDKWEEDILGTQAEGWASADVSPTIIALTDHRPCGRLTFIQKTLIILFRKSKCWQS